MWIQALENGYKFARPKPARKNSFGLEHLEIRMCSGTSTESVAAAKPAFAITSSSQDDPDHRLENDTKARILDTPAGKRRIFNTDTDGDIVVKTDGEDYSGAILYQVT